MHIIQDQIDEVKELWRNKRVLTHQLLNLGMVVFTALMIWKGLMFVTMSESPVVVVLSGSMETAFFKGDILLLDNRPTNMDIGDIVVYKLQGKDIPIVHRVLEHRSLSNGEDVYLTKGDNNMADDRGLYADVQPGKLWVRRDEMLGRAVGFLPKVGYLTIYLNENEKVKYALIGIMALFVLTAKE